MTKLVRNVIETMGIDWKYKWLVKVNISRILFLFFFLVVMLKFLLLSKYLKKISAFIIGVKFSVFLLIVIYIYIYVFTYIKGKVVLVTVVEGNLKAPFLWATTLRCRRGCSLSSTRQHLTQNGRLEEGEVGHEPRLEPCWTMMQLAHPWSVPYNAEG